MQRGVRWAEGRGERGIGQRIGGTHSNRLVPKTQPAVTVMQHDLVAPHRALLRIAPTYSSSNDGTVPLYLYVCLEQVQAMPEDPAPRARRLRAAGFPERRAAALAAQPGAELQEGSFWQADHIVAVSEGGGECGMDNYRCGLGPRTGRKRAGTRSSCWV